MFLACTSVAKKQEMAKREREREKVISSRKQANSCW